MLERLTKVFHTFGAVIHKHWDKLKDSFVFSSFEYARGLLKNTLRAVGSTVAPHFRCLLSNKNGSSYLKLMFKSHGLKGAIDWLLLQS